MKKRDRLIYSITIFVIALMIVLQVIIGNYENYARSVSSDEIFSLGLANNTEDYMFFSDEVIQQVCNSDGWFAGKNYNNYITVQQDERWRYDNVFTKQKADVHPPLYYCLVHTICSLTPDAVNYPGVIGINIAAICGELIVLYFIMRKIFGNTIYNVLPCVLWGFSMASMELRDYIRMYALLNFFVLCVLYLHICIIIDKEVTKKRIIQIALIVCFGGLTHYYFYMYTFFVAGIFLVMKIWKTRKNILENKIFFIKYVISYLIGGGIALLIFPKAVYHVLKTNVGNQVKGNLLSGTMQIGETLGIINENVFFNKFSYVFILLCVFFFSILVMKGKEKKIQSRGMEKFNACIDLQEYISVLILIGSSVLCYLLLLMKVTIYVAWYYISPAFVSILLFVILVFGYGYFAEKRIVSWIFGSILLVSSIGLFYTNQVLKWSEKIENNISYQQMIHSFSGMDCIYVSESWNCLYGNHLPDMAVMDEVRCIKEEDYMQTDFVSLLKGRDTVTEDIVLIFRKIEQPDYYVEKIKTQTGWEAEKVWNDEKNAFYLLCQ